MNKLLAVLKREYLQAVRKKMFIVMTFLLPFLMALVMAIPTMMIKRGLEEKKVIVLDGTGQLAAAFAEAEAGAGGRSQLEQKLEEETANVKIDYVAVPAAALEEKTGEYLTALRSEEKKEDARRFDAVAIIPADIFESEDDVVLTIYGRTSADVVVQQRVRGALKRALQRQRLTTAAVDPAVIEKVLADVEIDAVQVTRSGEEKRGGEMNLIIAFVFALLMIMPVFIHGNEIMRGIVQEKTERVVEVLVSSMTPAELLTGKVLGLALVGLTQTAVWMLMAALAGGYSATVAVVAGVDLGEFLRPAVFFYFMLFFLLGYLMLVCVYAIGGAACNSEKDAQQLMAPMVMVMMIPWFLMMPILTSPDSALAVTLSLVPLFAPMTMFARVLVSEPPLWQIALSIVLTLATIWAFLMVTAKIFRVGILAYGKRPTIPELWRWLRVA